MSYRTKMLGRAASAVAPNPLGGLSEPLLSKNDERVNVGGGEGEEEEVHDPFASVFVIAGAVLLGAAGIAASAAAMVTGPGLIAVYVAGGFCVVNSGTIVKNQYDLSKGKGYRQGINALRKEANRLGEEVDLLTQAVNDLQAEADLMEGLEQQLSDIARKQGVNVNEIVMLVRENEEILTKQKANLKQTFISDITKAFISSEFLTGDMRIDMKNLPVLLLRLQLQLNSHGMSLDTDKFTEMVQQNNNDVSLILRKCGDMLTLDDKGKASTQAMDMVTVDKQYSKGSVDVARGKTPQLVNKKLEHRNTVVRDVKRGLSSKGIEVLDSDEESSVISDYDEASARSGSRGMRSTGYEQQKIAPGQESRSRTAGKFKAAAKVSKLAGAPKRDDNYDFEVDTRSTQQRGHAKTKFKSAAMMASTATSHSSSSNPKRMARKDSGMADLRSSRAGPKHSDSDVRQSSGLETMRKARSVDKAFTAFKRSSTHSGDDAASVSSKGSLGRGGRKPSMFTSSISKTHDDDFSHASSTSTRRRTRSVDKALASFKTSFRSGGASASSYGARKSQSQPRAKRAGEPRDSATRREGGGFDSVSTSSSGAKPSRARGSSRSRRRATVESDMAPTTSRGAPGGGGRRRVHNRDGSF